MIGSYASRKTTPMWLKARCQGVQVFGGDLFQKCNYDSDLNFIEFPIWIFLNLIVLCCHEAETKSKSQSWCVKFVCLCLFVDMTATPRTLPRMIDWCCFNHFVRNSLVALLEALCARILFFSFVEMHSSGVIMSRALKSLARQPPTMHIGKRRGGRGFLSSEPIFGLDFVPINYRTTIKLYWKTFYTGTSHQQCCNFLSFLRGEYPT